MLEGLKVVEFATYVAGPSAATVMADWGADVIKIESASGDPTRHLFSGNPNLTGNPVFEFENRGKRGAVLDISKPAGRAALLKILAKADVFITNLRPGSMARNKLDYDSLKGDLPGLIYCSVTGYGLEGDHIDRPAFDTAALWTRAGVAGATIPEGVAPFQGRPGAGDAICALATCSAVLAAVIEKKATGKGRLVETSLMRAGVYMIGWDMSIQLKYGRLQRTRERHVKANPASNYFLTKDQRWVVVLPRGNADWADVAAAIGREDLPKDERFSSVKARRENAAALLAELEAGFAQHTLGELEPRLTQMDVMWAPLQTPAQVAEDSYAHAAGCFIEVTDRAGETFLAPASPARFPGLDDRTHRPAPGLGADTRAILREAGYADGDIETLFREGAAIENA
ncbi:MAG TPA: CoA transferase [Caulobacterales bacterium]|jgi:crotonobetainyl-CoA:carnitine CoA-transferase CaiB-like acyl-CoA transferase|nr:CoA transferase [Caulobacterales bacterium]